MDTLKVEGINTIYGDTRLWTPLIEKFPEKDGLYEVTIDSSNLNHPNQVILLEYSQKSPLPLWDLNSRYERVIAWREKPKPYHYPFPRFPYYGGIWIHRKEIQNFNFKVDIRTGHAKWDIKTYDKTIIFPFNFNGIYCFNEKSGINKMLHVHDMESSVEFLFSLYKKNEDTQDYLYNYFGFGSL